MRGGNAPRDRALTVNVRRRLQHAKRPVGRFTKPPERRVIKCARVQSHWRCSRPSPPFRYGDPQRGKGRGESRAAQRLIGCRQPPAQLGSPLDSCSHAMWTLCATTACLCSNHRGQAPSAERETRHDSPRKTGRCTGAMTLIRPGEKSRTTMDGDSEAHASFHPLRRVGGKMRWQCIT